MTDERQTDKLNRLRAANFRYYLAYWLTEPDQRPFALTLLNLAVELDAIPAKVREPMLGLIRITWWRDAMLGLAGDEKAAHPLLQPFLDINIEQERLAVIASWVETFDALFIDPSDCAAQLAKRYQLYQSFIGVSAGKFLNRTNQIDGQLPLITAAIKHVILGKYLRN